MLIFNQISGQFLRNICWEPGNPSAKSVMEQIQAQRICLSEGWVTPKLVRHWNYLSKSQVDKMYVFDVV